MYQEPIDKPFRFSGGGYPCPYCNARRGWSYLKDHGKDYGLCFACGARRFPAGEHPVAATPLVNAATGLPQYVPLQVVNRTLTAFEHNPFLRFIADTFGMEAQMHLGARFLIGSAKGGGTVFWHIDHQGCFCRPKVMFYQQDGHRCKDRAPHFGGYTAARGYCLPLFGEHQLALYPASVPVLLVESEKTACIGFLAFPHYLWLATGGAASLNSKRAGVLQGRKVYLLPDADEAGRTGAEKARQLLDGMDIWVTGIDLFAGRNDHTDLADYLIEQLQEKQLPSTTTRQLPLAHPLAAKQVAEAQRLFTKYPYLWKLSDEMDLVITG